MTHRLLSRQLRRHLGLGSDENPAALLEELSRLVEGHSPRLKTLASGLKEFITQVGISYEQSDRDLELAQRSLEISSDELTQTNEKLRRESDIREATLHSLRETTNRLLAPLGRHIDEDDGLQALTGHLDELVSDLFKTRRELEKTLKELSNRQFALDQHAIVSITDADGLITYANQRFIDISGYALEELMGKNHRLVSSGMHDKAFFQGMWSTISAAKVWHGEVCNRSRNGTLYWVSATIVPILSNDGVPVSYISIRTDITGQKQLEQRIQLEQRYLQSVMDTIGEGVYTLDAKGTCTFVNREAETMLGWSREEMEGCNLHDLIHFQKLDGSPVSRDECPTHQCIRDGKVYRSVDDAFTRKDGSIFAISVIASPLIENDVIVGTVAAFQDITERKRFEAEIVRAKEVAEEASHAKSDFLATMSHEIRTPMNGIIGMTELALDTALSREQREYLSLVKTSADNLLEIINDILDFSKIEAGFVALESIPFRVNELVSTALRPLGIRAMQKGVELVYESDADIPDTLVGDPGRLRQILVNLVGNAIKFTSKGEIRINVRLLHQSADQISLRFEVADQGIGIPAEKQRSIFDPFTQADTSTTRRFGGTGLGLAICARLVRAMGGDIGVISTVGEGSTFHFTVNLAVGDIEPVSPLLLQELANIPALVVDDNEANRRLLEGLLRKWGMRPTAVDNGLAALTSIAQADASGQPYRILLLDAMMPGMDGFEVAARIRADQRSSNIVIIMLTSGGARGDAERCRELGMEGYLTKPIRQEELLTAVLAAASHDRSPSAPLITHHFIAEENAKPLHILLAEDNLVNQKLALTHLEKWGHKVQIANNGQEALDMSLHQHFDLILMDMQMPILGGVEATRLIRAREQKSGGHVRIVAMTANAMAGDKETCINAGMDDYLTKPLKKEELADMLKQQPVGAQGAPAAEVAPPSAEAEFDYRAALAQADRWVIDVISDIFRQDWRDQMKAMRGAIAGGDREVLLRGAHTLKGLLGNFNAAPAEVLARKLELLATQGDFVHAPPALDDLEKALKLLDNALEDFTKTTP